MYFRIVIILFFLLFFTLPGYATVKLPKLVSDGMVLQRDAEVKILGWADPGEKIFLNFLDAHHTAVANISGEWVIPLPAMKAGGPFRMEINGDNTIVLENILIGDVWICSGQSNMELNLTRARPLYEKEIAEAGNTFIRYFEVPKKYNFNTPQQDLSGGHWESPDPESVLHFSAVSYFYGLALYEKYQVPIGLINTALGGSPAEAWISEDAIKAFPDHYQELQPFKMVKYITMIEASDRARSGDWFRRLSMLDEGYQEPGLNWYQPEVNTSSWTTMDIPGYWADEPLGEVNGVVWFRKTFDAPEAMAAQPAKLLMGRIVDADSVYLNGVFVGTTSYQYPPRRYQVPAGVLKAGKNTLVVRVASQRGQGGFVPDKPYELSAGGQKIDLRGTWQYRLGAKMEELGEQTFVRWKPTGLYNAMIAPLLNFRIKGVIWYQGESNADRPEEYRSLFPAMIRNWREKWGQGDFPFLFVQLPNFMEAKAQPSESNWALLREAQLQTLALPHTGMAVAIDLGEWNDIHPLNKKDVAKRLALVAQKVAYGDKKVVYSGPVFKSMKIKGNKAVITFDHVSGGLTAQGGGPLRGFAIAAKDGSFVWAEARIRGNKVEVWSDKIPHPVSIRYAWADNPENANLYNEEGLPASPFRTDK